MAGLPTVTVEAIDDPAAPGTGVPVTLVAIAGGPTLAVADTGDGAVLLWPVRGLPPRLSRAAAADLRALAARHPLADDGDDGGGHG